MPKTPRRFTNPDPMPDVSRFALHLDRAAIDEVCHHTHWIPNLKGFTRRFFSKNYPGWDIGAMMAVFTAAGVLVRDDKGSPFGGRCHWKVRTLHFTSHEDFLVEWNTDTEDDGRFFWDGMRDDDPGTTTDTDVSDDAGGGVGSFSVEGSQVPFGDEEAMIEFAMSLLRMMAPRPQKPHDPARTLAEQSDAGAETDGADGPNGV
jgi:hypothetical protein